MAAPDSAYAVALTGSNQVGLVTAPCEFRGIAIRETAGSTAVVEVYDNASANTGTLLGCYSLNGAGANASADVFVCIECVKGISVKIVSGTVAGSVRVG